ncbi:MAG: glycosyltransferase, partial [Oscillospiraceae bacterium]|nr:glycosyltransferase [Oscillospiraceae bacterium]
MNILHYFLGFPPYRSGGLTKYAFDVMSAQVDMGYRVSALWPGEIKLFGNTVRICRRKEISGIHSYELINPLPVALDEGVADPAAYMVPCKNEAYEEFLK